MKPPQPKKGAGATGKGKPRTRRRGLPPESAVVAETTMTSPKGATYRVLKTTEKDAYDPVEPPRGRTRDGD